MLIVRQKVFAFFSLLLPLTGFAQGVDTVQVRRFMENPLGLLEGRVAGVEVIDGTLKPGLGTQVWVHGVPPNSLMTPVFVVDGMRVFGMPSLSQDEVEEMEVLTDPTLISEYGPEALNGVVRIRTRRAREEGFHADYQFLGGPSWLRESGMGGRSAFVHRHDAGLAYRSKLIAARTSFSFLDNKDLSSAEDALDRYPVFSGTWSLDVHPLSWLSAGTTGFWRRGRHLAEGSSSEHTVLSMDYLDYRNMFAGGRLWAEATPIAGLFIRPFADLFAVNQVQKSIYQYSESDLPGGNMIGTVSEVSSRMWEIGLAAGYSKELARDQRLAADVNFRWAPIKTGTTGISSQEKSIPDRDGYLSSLQSRLPERNVDRRNWMDMSMKLGYHYLGRYDVEGGVQGRVLNRVSGQTFSVAPLFALGWTLTGEPWLRSVLPGWMERIAFRAAYASDRFLPLSTYMDDSRYDIITTLIPNLYDSTPESIFSSRRSLRGEMDFKAAGEWHLAVEGYSSDDDLLSLGTSGELSPYAKVRRTGWDFSADWRFSKGDWCFSVGGVASLYGSHVTLTDAAQMVFLNEAYAVSGGGLWMLPGGALSPQPEWRVMPTVSYGVHADVSWKRFGFHFLGDGKEGNHILREGRDTPEEASYFRIDQLCLDYRLPERWFSALPISGVRLSVSLEDAFLLTKYTGKNDPDTALLWTFYFGRDREDMLPASRLMFGVSIKL
jgi:hypothetical protein